VWLKEIRKHPKLMEDIHAREVAIESCEAKVAEIEAKLLKLDKKGNIKSQRICMSFESK
jgi:hypothetical protein